MTYAVRVSDQDYVSVVGRHVDEGQSVVPGLPLLDIMTPDGMVETIFSEGWGIVAHVEGNRVFADDIPVAATNGRASATYDPQSGFPAQGVVFPKGNTLCHIVERDGYRTGTIRGLTPRPTTVIARRRARGINLNY